MGCCLNKGSREDEDHLELSDAVNDSVTCKCGNKGESVQVVKEIGKNSFTVSGQGTVIGSCPLDGDTSTWQIRIGKDPSGVNIGIKRYNKKKAPSLNGVLTDTSGDVNGEASAWWLKDVVLSEGDVVGVYWDQTDLPMLSFSLNGALLMNASIMRVRPANEIYPAVSVSGDSSCEIIFDGEAFAHPPISSKFKMIICSTSLI